jgi:hypothetical protein
MLYAPSLRGELSGSSLPPMSGAYTPQQRREGQVSNTNEGSWGLMTRSNGRSSSRSASMHKTPQDEPPQGLGLREDMCSSSIPTSPDYFDLLPGEEMDMYAPPYWLSLKRVGLEKRVRFAASPPPPHPSQVPETAHTAQRTGEVDMRTPALLPRPTGQKKRMLRTHPDCSETPVTGGRGPSGQAPAEISREGEVLPW